MLANRVDSGVLFCFIIFPILLSHFTPPPPAALVPNIAEMVNAVQFALQNRIDLSIEIGLAAAVQVRGGGGFKTFTVQNKTPESNLLAYIGK